jgi:hypothetical protein
MESLSARDWRLVVPSARATQIATPIPATTAMAMIRRLQNVSFPGKPGHRTPRAVRGGS